MGHANECRRRAIPSSGLSDENPEPLMTVFKKYLNWIAVTLWAAAMPAFAASSAASSASESLTTSVGSSSTSIQKSSNSSSKNKDVAAGDYCIVEVSALAERPGILRMKLQAIADASADGELFLDLPQIAVDQAGLVAGQTIAAISRSYGTEFASGAVRQAFYLVMNDDWYRELQIKAVAL
jgi:cytoskeletal protein RodZ